MTDPSASGAGVATPVPERTAVVAELQRELRAAGLTGSVLRGLAAAAVARLDGAVEPAPPSWADEVTTRLDSGALDDGDLPALVRLLATTGQHRLLARTGVRFPAYALTDDVAAARVGPPGPRLPVRPRATGSWEVLGRRVGFPIGVPACPMTGTAAWVQYLAGNGFNVLTYKTVRSRAHAANAFPNWAFVPGVREPFGPGAPPVVRADPSDWVTPGDPAVTSTNSFGVPSPDPGVWTEDVAAAVRCLAEDQLLLVSVMGEDDGEGPAQLQAVADDFARTAVLAEAAGAPVVELNLSCPNTLGSGGGVRPPICRDAELTTAIVETTRRALSSSTGLVAKLSWLDGPALAGLLPRIAPHLDGVAAINTVQCAVQRADGTPTFPGRPLAGVSGRAVRDLALEFTARLLELRAAGGHRFDVLAMGGVTDPASAAALLELGAAGVQSATGAWADPYLARACVEELA
ncbi:dihydroorotate oxidase [Modestobacter sp. VKM Ac-2986]|uniref:dihydroorotate oxidase n=1 Tax=Modestobacter sp. VKM Ac-2986 TaxID=3004140 RepID=UPI0022AAF58C|nr:dihydroorotate oxidase [Modestobacter sp. VKM Ac-2986]MCZ2828161.1 dihydroorotate oxidase [Modestobacter sp. VKM Ac-2986]